MAGLLPQSATMVADCCLFLLHLLPMPLSPVLLMSQAGVVLQPDWPLGHSILHQSQIEVQLRMTKDEKAYGHHLTHHWRSHCCGSW
jgi:hypothetical protein